MHNKRWFALLPIGLGMACGSDPTSDNTPSADDAPSLNRQGAALFRGAGSSGAGEPLGAEIPPSTAHDCVPVGAGIDDVAAGPAETTCYFSEEDPETHSATLERRLEIINDERWIHLRLTFSPDFVDNSYGETAIGWGDSTDDAVDPTATGDKKKAKGKGKSGHTFKELVGSDHAEFQLFDTQGELKTQFKVDYLSETDEAPSGYASAGVSGGDGKMIVGEPAWILGATSSLDRNLNGCGLDAYIVDSPETDESYSPNPDAPAWDFRVVYEVWVAEEPFGDGGFGEAKIEYVHASPSKGEDNTLIVVPGPCTPPSTSTPDASTPPPETEDPPPDVEDPPPSDTPDAGAIPPTRYVPK